MLVGVPQIDWVTYTTFDERIFKRAKSDWVFFIHREIEYENKYMMRQAKKDRSLTYAPRSFSSESKKIMQYSGIQVDGVFFGEGEQSGKKHYYIRCSGAGAHRVAERMEPFKMRCTRIDLQVTEPVPRGFTSLKLRNELRDASWKGRKPVIDLGHVDERDMGTVYLGSRSSERFLRIYVKRDDFGNEYLRYELELTKSVAESAGKMLSEYGGSELCMRVLSDSISRLPVDANLDYHVELLDCFLWLTQAPPVRPKPSYRVGDASTRMDWLERVVFPAMMKALRDKETSDRAHGLLAKMVSTAVLDITEDGEDVKY